MAAAHIHAELWGDEVDNGSPLLANNAADVFVTPNGETVTIELRSIAARKLLAGERVASITVGLIGAKHRINAAVTNGLSVQTDNPYFVTCLANLDESAQPEKPEPLPWLLNYLHNQNS